MSMNEKFSYDSTEKDILLAIYNLLVEIRDCLKKNIVGDNYG